MLPDDEVLKLVWKGVLVRVVDDWFLSVNDAENGTMLGTYGLSMIGFRRSMDACSLVATLFEGQWSVPTGAHSRGDGSLTGQGLDSVFAESREQVFGVARANTTLVRL